MRHNARFTTELRIWLNINTTGQWAQWGISGFTSCLIYFELVEDAAAFKLRWT